MNLSLAKDIAILGLSFILTSSGLPWALQRCLTDDASEGHLHSAQAESAPATNHRAFPSGAVVFEHRHQPSRIHCTETQILKLSFGPASSVFRFEPPKDGGVKAFLAVALSNTTGTLNARLAGSIYLLVKPHLSPHSLIPKFRI